MRELLDGVIAALRQGCRSEVYPSFDAVPLPKKSDRLFAVAELRRVQLDAPFPDGSHAVHPFTAEVRISVLVPMTSPVQRAEDFLYGSVMPVMDTLGAVLCEVQPALADARLQRVMLQAVFKLKGIYLAGVTA